MVNLTFFNSCQRPCVQITVSSSSPPFSQGKITYQRKHFPSKTTYLPRRQKSRTRKQRKTGRALVKGRITCWQKGQALDLHFDLFVTLIVCWLLTQFCYHFSPDVLAHVCLTPCSVLHLIVLIFSWSGRSATALKV